jgi:hypothetical protein
MHLQVAKQFLKENYCLRPLFHNDAGSIKESNSKLIHLQLAFKKICNCCTRNMLFLYKTGLMAGEYNFQERWN